MALHFHSRHYNLCRNLKWFLLTKCMHIKKKKKEQQNAWNLYSKHNLWKKKYNIKPLYQSQFIWSCNLLIVESGFTERPSELELDLARYVVKSIHYSRNLACTFLVIWFNFTTWSDFCLSKPMKTKCLNIKNDITWEKNRFKI